MNYISVFFLFYFIVKCAVKFLSKKNLSSLEKNIPLEIKPEVEYPDEFLDPLMSTCMTDPVIMPTSGISIDRSVILQWLKTSDQDPFNRMPLKAADLKDNTELKAKIDAFNKK